ncbi:V-type ATP synthase subunit D [Georgenia satyanarayanai]|uniref:V-type ATP synthase subunit D n=1 Tax=Georgenia satyanarayanai TaxID=860221 RepID=UPI001265395A|nr:V-type ATP synthase subunit D [Georgenia satyanarayanai]
MAGVSQAPPGRAGRLWLQHRLTTAQHGSELLDRKLRILRTERESHSLLVERTGRALVAATTEAHRWSLRAAVLVGQAPLHLAVAPAPATVEISWGETMGVRYPVTARCVFPEPAGDEPAPGSAALVLAREACARALDAAAAHAAAQAAVRVLEEQEAATRRRLRAIEDRWVPRLRAALAEAELRLEEEERTEGLRLRWAAGTGRAGEG